jgi:hypothetical protein
MESKTLTINLPRTMINVLNPTVLNETIKDGYEALDRRLDTEDSSKVLDDFWLLYSSNFPYHPVEEYTITLDKKLYGRLVVMSNEYSVHMSQLIAECIAYTLSHE